MTKDVEFHRLGGAAECCCWTCVRSANRHSTVYPKQATMRATRAELDVCEACNTNPHRESYCVCKRPGSCGLAFREWCCTVPAGDKMCSLASNCP